MMARRLGVGGWGGLFRNNVVLAGAWVCAWGGFDAGAAALDLESYLSQTRQQGLSQKISKANLEAEELKSVEGGLQYSPSLTLSAGYTDDVREQLFAAFNGTRNTGLSINAILSQQFSWGMTAKLTYALQSATYFGSTILVPSPYTIYQSEPKLEIVQSIWSNGLGVSTRATREATDATHMSTAAMERYKSLQVASGAEQAYWRLAFARKTLEVQSEVLKRAKSLADWNEKRMNMNLADRSDYLQSSAALQLRQLDVRGSVEEIRAASIAFNTERSLDGADVPEELQTPTEAQLLALEVAGLDQDLPARPREDVVAAQHMQVASLANQRIAMERYKPSLDVTLTLGGNGIDTASLAPALAQSWALNFPYFSAVAKLVIPLDQWGYGEMREAARRSMASAEMQLSKSTLDQAQEWRDLTKAFRDLKARFKLGVALANLQREKLSHERDRLKRGRSTTYQVILFEQDSLQAELNLIRMSADLLRTFARLKTFGAQS